MKEFTQDGMFNELSKVTRALNKSKYEKMDLPQYGKGGEDPVTNSQVDTDKDYYIRMANSPLFVERYARMVGKPVDQVGEEAEAYRQQILNNIETVKINDVGVLPKGVRRRDIWDKEGVYYSPLKKEDIDKAYEFANDLPKLFRKGFLRRINKEIQNYPDHQLFLYENNPWVRTHELSHGSVKGEIDKKNVNEYNFKDMSSEPTRIQNYYEGREEYLTGPDEQKARIDVARKYLENKGLYDPVNEPFTEKHYKHLNNELIKNFFKVGKNQGFESDADPNLPLDIEEIMNPYDEKTVIDMFNNFVSNDSKQDLQQGRLGGLTKFIDGGGAIYTYSGRPDSIYKTVNGQWHIKNDSTNGQFIPINDPTGGRTNVLNQHAVKVDESLYKPKPIALPKMQPSETTQMFQPIINNAVSAQNLNLARATHERNQNIARGEKAIKQSIASIQNNKNYTQKEKDELIKKEYDRLLDFDNRNQIEETGALLNKLDQQTIKAAPEKTTGDYAERAWDIITNPFDAAKYSISGGGLENMPWNYNKMKEIGIDPSAQSYQERFSGSDKKSNMVGDVLNTFNLFDAGDKVYRNAEKGNWEDALLEATRFLEVGAFMKPGTLGNIAKYTTNNPIDNAKNLLNSDKANAFIGSMYQKGLDIGNPINNFVRKLSNKPYTSSDLVAKINSLAAPAKYEDLSKGVKALEDISQESFDFWKTQEGRRRIKKYLDDNDLSNFGIDEDMYIDMMKDVDISKANEAKNIRNVHTEIANERELLRQKREAINKEIDEVMRLNDELRLQHGWTYQDPDIMNRLQKLNNDLDENIKIDHGHIKSLFDLPNYPSDNAHYRGEDESVFLGEDYVKKSNVDNAGVHEWGHAKNVQPLIKLAKAFPGYTPDIEQIALNKRLRNTLDLEGPLNINNAEDLPEHLKNIDYEKLYNNAQSIAPSTVERWSLPQRYWNSQANYFMHGDEANAFLQELIPELKRRGFIKKFGDHIEPQMIDQLFADYRKEAATKIIDPIRLLDIVKPTGKSIQSITDELNNLHILAPIAIGAGAAAAASSNEKSPLPQQQRFGGNISNLQKFLR